MKNYIKPMLYIFAIIIASLLLLTLFNYFNVITGTFFNILLFVIPSVSVFVGGIMIGKTSFKKGWLSGLKLSLILIIVFLLLSLIFGIDVKFKSLFYFLILIVFTMFGSMLGINKKHL